MANTDTVRGAERRALIELDDVVRRTDARLHAFLGAERARWAELDEQLAEPVDILAELVLQGGKRLRPAFCHWGHWAVTGEGEPPAHVVDVGAALELLHAFALAHDDVMDASTSRRGRPTTHQAQGARHRVEGWRGGSNRFGENVAILVGDLGHTYARRLVDGAAPATPTVRCLWDQLETEVVLGQYLDVAGTASGGVPLHRALRVAELKSARYTVARPLALGAALAGADPAPAALHEYGSSIGLAFQLRDDVLGVCGSPAVTGKPVGDDLVEGKPTPLVAIAAERATPAQARLLATIGTPGCDVAAVTEVLADTGALDEVERRIEALTDRGVRAVTSAEAAIDPCAGELLARVAEQLCRRSA